MCGHSHHAGETPRERELRSHTREAVPPRPDAAHQWGELCLVGRFVNDPPPGKRRRNIFSPRTRRKGPPACPRPHEQHDLGIVARDSVDLSTNCCPLHVAEMVEALDIEDEAIPRADVSVAQCGHAPLDETDRDTPLLGPALSVLHGPGDDVDACDVPTTCGQFSRPPPPAAPEVKCSTKRPFHTLLDPIHERPQLRCHTFGIRFPGSESHRVQKTVQAAHQASLAPRTSSTGRTCPLLTHDLETSRPAATAR